MIIRTRAFARAGLIGNPSDGYFGKTISIVLRNFSASVTLYESPELAIVPHGRDHSIFASMDALTDDVRVNGYYGGVRLLKATVKKFGDYCREEGIALEDKNFTLRYETNIPRRVGMAGSSAIVTSALRALMEFYGVEIPRPVQPNGVLSVETEELGISAGLQDRVVQVWEGMVYMDFAKELMERQGYGDYEAMDPELLPPLFVAYKNELGSGSEVFHNDVRHRWLSGEKAVIKAMHRCAEDAARARDALVAGKPEKLGELMDNNFDARASIYKLPGEHVRMVELAREIGAHAKFSGSGGAVIGTYEGEEMYERLKEAYQAEGSEVFRPRITE